MLLLQFQFKDVKFMQHRSETLTIHNDGQVPCQFEFIQKLDEPAYCKPWLTANPHKGFLAQGKVLKCLPLASVTPLHILDYQLYTISVVYY